MKHHISKMGLIVSLLYIVMSVALIASQGLFGESFITLILGLPWSLVPAFFEFGGATGVLLYVYVLLPLALNASILYCLGSLFDRKKTNDKEQTE